MREPIKLPFTSVANYCLSLFFFFCCMGISAVALTPSRETASTKRPRTPARSGFGVAKIIQQLLSTLNKAQTDPSFIPEYLTLFIAVSNFFFFLKSRFACFSSMSHQLQRSSVLQHQRKMSITFARITLFSYFASIAKATAPAKMHEPCRR
jgi:hypothetical protein